MIPMEIRESIARKRQTSKQREFLNHFLNLGNIRQSAKQAGVSRALIYWWRDNSPLFAERLSAATIKAFGESEREPTQITLTQAQRGLVRKRGKITP